MEGTRRLVIAAALGLVVLALAASFWGSHAMLTSLIASLLVLAVTVVVLNELLARRDRRRWSVLAQHVLFQGRVDWISDVLAHNEPNEGRSLVRRKLVRSSLAAEHVAILEPDWGPRPDRLDRPAGGSPGLRVARAGLQAGAVRGVGEANPHVRRRASDAQRLSSQIRRSPSSVSRSSTASIDSVNDGTRWWASPPVAITGASAPSSSRSRPTMPSTCPAKP